MKIQSGESNGSSQVILAPRDEQTRKGLRKGRDLAKSFQRHKAAKGLAKRGK